jgi:hypothetical protein
MLSIEDIVKKTTVQRKTIREVMDGFGYYHPDMRRSRGDPVASITQGLKPADAIDVATSIRQIPLSEFLNRVKLEEFLAKSGTTGMQGAAYLVPVKAHDMLINYSMATDLVPLFSSRIIHDWKGDSWTLTVADDLQYRPYPFSSGGAQPAMHGDFSQVTLDFTQDRKLGIHVAAGADLVEDVTDYDVIDWHIQQAAQAFGREATDRALTVLQTATDGIGTVNAAATGDADETRLINGTTTDIGDCVRALGYDRWVANTMIITSEAWMHSVATQAAEVGWLMVPPTTGFHTKIGILDTLLCNSVNLHASTDAEGAAFTNCITIICDRLNALATGRKRWLRMENYSDPVKDLMGAVVVGEQDSVTLYDDSVYRLTET